MVGRGEEVADDETGQQLDQPRRARAGAGTGRRAATRNTVATRMMRGRPSTVSWPSVSPGSDGEHEGEVLVVAQLVRWRTTTVRTSRSSRSSASSRWPAEPGEEVLQLAHAQRLEQHVLAAGEHAVERRPRHAGLGGDVVDGDLGDAPALDSSAWRRRARALPSVIPWQRGDGSASSGETLRRIPSHRQGSTSATPRPIPD